MSLASNALFASLNEFKERVGISLTETNYNDTQLEHHINAASSMIENYLNRKLITPSAVITETWEGDGLFYYYPKNQPISTSASNALYYWDGDSWVSVSTSTYPWSYDTDFNGRVYFTDGDTFWKYGQRGFRNWRFDYFYGYTVASVPQDIKIAATELVLRSLRLMEKTGFASEGFGDATTTYNLQSGIPENVELLLSKYKRVYI